MNAVQILRCAILGIILLILNSSGANAGEEEEIREIKTVPPVSTAGKFDIRVNWLWYAQDNSIEYLELSQILPSEEILGLLDSLSDSLQDLRSQSHSYTIQSGYQVLPILNVYGLLGGVDARYEAILAPPFSEHIHFGLDGLLYGGGATAAIGENNWFVATDIHYTFTDFGEQLEIDSWRISPKVGLTKGALSIWVGATYQETRQASNGELEVDDVIIGYKSISTDADNWNYKIGAHYQFSDRWSILVEGGFGRRESTYVSLGWRF